MADYKAIASTAYSLTSTWSGGVVPPNSAGHNIYSNGFTVPIDIDINVAMLTNASGGTVSAVTGGRFTVSGTRSITGNLVSGPNNSLVLMTYSGNSGTTLTITGNLTGGGANTAHALNLTGTGTTVINGNCAGGTGTSVSNSYAINIGATGINHTSITVNGTVTGGSGTGTNNFGINIAAINSTNVTVTGVSAGPLSGSAANHALSVAGSGTYTLGALTSTAFGGAFVYNSGTGATVTQSGAITCGGANSAVYVPASTNITINCTGIITPTAFTAGVFNLVGSGGSFNYQSGAVGATSLTFAGMSGFLLSAGLGTGNTACSYTIGSSGNPVNITHGTGGAGCTSLVTSTPSSVFTFYGNLVGGAAASAGGSCVYGNAINFGSITVNGNIQGGTATSACGVYVSGAGVTGNITITGTVTAGSTAATSNCHGLVSSSIGGTHTLQSGLTGSANGLGFQSTGNAAIINISGGSLTSAAGGCLSVSGGPTAGAGTGIQITINSGNLATSAAGIGINVGNLSYGSFTFTGNITATSGTGLSIASTAGQASTVLITGNVTGGASAGFYLSGPSTVTITGNVIGGSAGSGLVTATTATGAISIGGNVVGGTSSANIYGVSCGIGMTSLSTLLTVTGTVTGGSLGSNSYGIFITGSMSLRVDGALFAGSGGAGTTAVNSSAVGSHTFNSGDITMTAFGGGIVLSGIGATYTIASGTWSIGAYTPGANICSFTGNNQSGTISTRNITNGATSSAAALNYAGTGSTHNFTGNITNTSLGQAISSSLGAGSTLNIIGNLTHGPAAANIPCLAHTGAGTINITGNVTAGTNAGVTNNHGVDNTGVGTINITGNVTAGASTSAYGARNNSTGTINIYGSAIGSATVNSGSPGAYNATSGTMFVQVSKSNNYPNDSITVPAYGTNAVTANNCSITVDAMEDGSGGWPATGGRHFLRGASTANYSKMRETNNGVIITMGEVSNDYPAPINVRAGTPYDFGAQTGTLAVPPPGSVALGVATDNTTGTAALSPTALLGSALLTRLGNCSTVDSTGEQLEAMGA